MACAMQYTVYGHLQLKVKIFTSIILNHHETCTYVHAESGKRHNCEGQFAACIGIYKKEGLIKDVLLELNRVLDLF